MKELQRLCAIERQERLFRLEKELEVSIFPPFH